MSRELGVYPVDRDATMRQHPSFQVAPLHACSARWRVRIWKRITDAAECRLRRAYDHLVDVEALHRPALGAYLSQSASRTERHRSAP